VGYLTVKPSYMVISSDALLLSDRQTDTPPMAKSCCSIDKNEGGKLPTYRWEQQYQQTE